MKLVICLGFAVVTALGAQAAPCTKTSFTSANGKIYKQAETALVKSGAPQTALDLTGELWDSNLNCYERQSVRRLRAATFAMMNDYKSAIELLEPLTKDESLPKQQRADTAGSIADLYTQHGEQRAAKPYIELKEKLLAQ